MDPYYKSQEFLDILAKYEAMRDNSADGFLDAADYADVAEYYLAQGDDTRARQAVVQGVEIFPDSLPPLAVLARIELSHGRFEQAREIIERTAEKDELEYHYVKAELMVAQGSCEEADRYLSQLESDDDPDDIALDICAIFIDHNEFKYAKKWLDRVKDRAKQDVQEFEAHILTGEGKLEECERKVNELLDEDPYSTEYWNHLAGVQYMRADYNASIDSSDFTLAIDANNAEALLNKANSFYALKNYEQALVFYDRFLALRPDNISALFYRGTTLVMLKKLDKAIETLKNCLRLDLQGVKAGDLRCEELLNDILHELSFELCEVGDYPQAHEHIDRALHAIRKREDMDALRSELYLSKAKVYFFQGDGEGAIECLENARQAYNRPETFVRMTAVLYECGYPDRAYDVLGEQLFSEEGCTWTTGHAYLARYAYELGKMDVFRTLLAMAVERNPEETHLVLYDIFPAGTHVNDYPYMDPIPLDDLN